MRGADLHALYQRQIDWPTVAQSDLAFFYVQLSRGAAPLVRDFEGVTYTPHAQCEGAHSIERLVGGYHWGLADKPPETQAAVFATQLYETGALGLPPALDLEDPWSATNPGTARFGTRFLLALREHGFDQVAVYSNAYTLSKIRPETWGVPGLVVWAADYGVDMAGGVAPVRYYTGPVDIRQYSKSGQIAGIGPGLVDLNRSDLAFKRFQSTPFQEG